MYVGSGMHTSLIYNHPISILYQLFYEFHHVITITALPHAQMVYGILVLMMFSVSVLAVVYWAVEEVVHRLCANSWQSKDGWKEST